MLNKNYSLSFWLKYLEKLDKKNIDNLSRLKNVANKLNLLNWKIFVFTVAGTNGKGTTCAVLESLLLHSGYQVGLYTSPHVMHYTERIRINGKVMAEKEHISAFKEIEHARNSICLTYFEFITLSALILFKRCYFLDVIILEVGLGGRLDATNIIDSDLSIVTNIGIDHTNVLGANRSCIAYEKSGIFRKNKISVIGEGNIPDIMLEIAKSKKTVLKKIHVDWYYEERNNYWNFIHSEIKLYRLPIPHIPLPSAAIGLSALYYAGFKIQEKIIRKIISNIFLIGRFQIVSFFPHIILDVAHNADSSLYLFQKICKINITGKIYAIIGVLKDKNVADIIKPFKKKIYHWCVAPLQTSRTTTKTELKKIFPIHNTSIFNSIKDASQMVNKRIQKNDSILVFGSFLTVSEFIRANSIKYQINSL